MMSPSMLFERLVEILICSYWNCTRKNNNDCTCTEATTYFLFISLNLMHEAYATRIHIHTQKKKQMTKFFLPFSMSVLFACLFCGFPQFCGEVRCLVKQSIQMLRNKDFNVSVKQHSPSYVLTHTHRHTHKKEEKERLTAERRSEAFFMTTDNARLDSFITVLLMSAIMITWLHYMVSSFHRFGTTFKI